MTGISKQYTVKEAAVIMRVAPITIYRWLDSGRLTGTKVSLRKWLISENDIQQFLDDLKENK